MCFAFGSLVLLVAGLALPPAAGNLAAKDRFNAGFEFKTMWQVVRSNPGGYLVGAVCWCPPHGNPGIGTGLAELGSSST
ncbi:MAG TPA: DUF4013 domain-containing protein [Levilinea sp.]|nr:DUF4013 domain-containing protein [Levilinea sp.]